MDVDAILRAFPTEEEREFLFEMVEPELAEGATTLKAHDEETLFDVDEVEDWTNIMGRQNRRMAFLRELKKHLEGSLHD